MANQTKDKPLLRDKNNLPAPQVWNQAGGTDCLGDYDPLPGDAVNGLKVQVTNPQTTQEVTGHVTVTVDNLPVTQPVSGTVNVGNLPADRQTDVLDRLSDILTELQGTLTILGTVAVSSLPAVSGNVTVDNLPVTQPVSGTVTVDNLPTDQQVHGTVAVSGTVATNATVTNFPAVQPVSLSGSLPAGTNVLGKTGIDPANNTVTISQAYTTPAHTVFGVTNASQIALAANASRKYAVLQNDSDTDIYIALGTAAVMNRGIKLNAGGGSYEIRSADGSLYKGDVYAICSVAGPKNLLLTEGV
jgi:hypothetical protein